MVTGSSSGIGFCVARGLKQRGYHVIATVRKQTDVQRIGAELGVETVQLDLANSESVKTAAARILQKCGGTLYALFNNAAYGQPGAVEDLSRNALREQLEVNLLGPHELTTRLLPAMRAQGYGRIIQNSSLLGYVALPYRGAYNASKYAFEGLSDTLRLELAGSGIHVSLIEPGPILSRFRANALLAFKRHIDAENSIHRDKYRALMQKLNKEGPVVPFTLPPDAVLAKVLRALASERPKARYYVTVPAYLFAFMKRILPHRAMDWVLSKV